MKPVVIIAIIGIVVAIGILASIVTFQQSEISDIRRQEYLESAAIQCNTIIANVNYFSNEAVNRASEEWQKCMDEAMNLYGNSFQIEKWKAQKQQLAENWIEVPSVYEETSDFSLDKYWAQRYEQVTDPIEKQQVERQKELMQERMDSCPEGTSLIDCIQLTTEKQPEEPKPYCLSPKYQLIEYTISVTYHRVDKNHNGYYCQYLDPHDGEMAFEDDRGLR